MSTDIRGHEDLLHHHHQAETPQAEMDNNDYKQFKPQKSQTASPTLHTHTHTAWNSNCKSQCQGH